MADPQNNQPPTAAPRSTLGPRPEVPAVRHAQLPADLVADPLAALTSANEIPVLPVQSVSRPCMLQQVRGPLAPQFIELRDADMILGRADDVDVRIPSSALSRRHMRIESYAFGHRVVDLDSANGVFLNEVRVHSAVMRDGDVLQLGNVVLLYHEGR
jgi:hypothetical protein